MQTFLKLRTNMAMLENIEIGVQIRRGILFLLLWFLSIFNPLFGQHLEVGSGHLGIVVYYHGILPGENYQVEVIRSGAGVEQMSWNLKAVRSVVGLSENKDRLPWLFEGMLPLEDKALSLLAQRMDKAENTADIPFYMSPNVAFPVGLAILDTLVRKQQSYNYSLQINGQNVGEPISILHNPDEKIKWMPRANGASHNELQIKSIWLIPEKHINDVYGFVTYRSAPFSDKFDRVFGLSVFTGSQDSIFAIFRDSTLPVEGVYHYFIQTVDRFGALGPVSEYVQGSNFPAGTEPIVTYFKAHGKRDQPYIELKWRLANSWRARSLALFKSRRFDGPYEKVSYLAPTDTAYIDIIEDVMESHFYYLEIDDFATNELSASAKVTSLSDFKIDAFPPEELSVSAEAEKIILVWRSAGKVDRGYYVLRTEGYGDDYSIISDFIPANPDMTEYTYVDSSSALAGNKYYSYAIISESHSYTLSEPSEPVSIRPDVKLFVPTPSQLSIRKNDFDESGTLIWEDLSSRHDDFCCYRVFARNKETQDSFRLLTEEFLLFETNFYQIDKIDPNLEYTVKAYDIFENESTFASPVFYEEVFGNFFGPSLLMGGSDNDGILIRWADPQNTRVVRYELFRTEDESVAPKSVAKLSKDTLQYLDTATTQGNYYYYFLVAYDANDRPGRPSEWIAVLR